MMKMNNCIILLMGFPGSGKNTVGNLLSNKTNFRLAHHHTWVDSIVKLLGDDYEVHWDFQ